MTIRLLGPADAGLYRELRLEALARDSQAFASTLAAESTQPLSWFADRLARSRTFGAFQGSELTGTAAYVIQAGEKRRHKATLVGMYVRPTARHQGIGTRLVTVLIDDARRHVEILQLSVVTDNHQALRLYERQGFVAYGVEKRSLKQGDRYDDEVLMAKRLD